MDLPLEMADKPTLCHQMQVSDADHLELQSSDRTTLKTSLRNRTVLRGTVMSTIFLRHCSRQCDQKRHSVGTNSV